MFNNLTPSHNEVDDIFADTDKAPAINPTPGMAPVTPASIASAPAPMPAAGTAPVAEEDFGGQARAGKVLKLLLIMIVILGVLGTGAYFVYTKYLTGIFNNAAVKTPLVQNATTTPAPGVAPIDNAGQPGLIAPTSSPDLSVPPVSNLITTSTPSLNPTSSQGVLPGTTPVIAPPATTAPAIGAVNNGVDTDHDGLTDYEEVHVYHTNPLNPDTDGDGYLDGAEVKGGYDPNGPGKLVK
jgi:hypothetical protein